MVGQSDTPSRDSRLSPLTEPQQITRRSSWTPCPVCGSTTVRARDGRDLCVVCGYLMKPFTSMQIDEKLAQIGLTSRW
jgi:hypothetical protein